VNKKTFKKIDIVKEISNITGFPVNLIKKIVNDYLMMLTYKIKKDRDFLIKNFGSFKIIDKKERVGRNPKTKEEFIITARKSISFTASKKLLKNVNSE
tara:strand:- start:303 stop:596 length:294 start_codon:yes stop_codon:yes gene_type:complete